MAYKVKVYSGRKKSPVMEVSDHGSNPIELSPVTLAAILGVTAVAAGVIVYLMTRASSSVPAAAPAVTTAQIPAATGTGLTGLGFIPGNRDHLTTMYMNTVDKLLG